MNMRINLKLLAALAAILLLAAFNSRAQSLIPDPGVPDTVYVDSVGTVATAGQVQVPVNFTNDQNLAGIGLTLTHDLSGLVIDSMSFTGSRLESYSVKGATIVDNWISVYMIVLSEPVLPPGNGLLGTLYLSFSPGIGDQFVTIDTITINQNDVEYNTTFTTEGSDYFYPQFEKGYVSIDGSGCCIDMRGNVNGDVDESVNVSDLTYFVNYLFGGGPAPICYEEADVNADGTLNVADLTFLVNYLFAGGAAPGACP
jgi:hypothetical protein